MLIINNKQRVFIYNLNINKYLRELREYKKVSRENKK